MGFETPMRRARGLGAAKEGVGHWWSQRVSAVAMVPLTLLAVPPFALSVGEGYDAVVATYSSPITAIIAILFMITTFQHLMLGLQTVIEDYVHHPLWRTGLLIGNTMFCWGFGLAGVFAIAKIAFGV